MLPSEKITPSVPWVQAALEVLPADNQPYQHAVLSTLRQEKSIEDANWLDKAQRMAWWTCEYCPQPHRWMDNIDHSDLRGDRDLTNMIRIGSDHAWRFVRVKRCKRCNRKRDRHHRAKRSLGKALAKQIEHMGTSARFVTLTTENEIIEMVDGVVDPTAMSESVRRLKKKMYNFSRTVQYQDKVIGAVEFYEQTFKIDEDKVSVNTHLHAIWLGHYWDQAEMQEAWGSIVHVTRPKSKKAVMKYISKYVTKDPVPGTRAKETRGVLRG